jgi:hypothetical protein
MGSSAVALAPSPGVVVPASPVRRRSVERVVRVALTAGIAVQLLQRFLTSGFELSEYGRSLWYVSYQSGFVRRGLAGELLRTALGSTPTLRAVDLLQNALGVTMLVATAALVLVLCRQRTVIAYATAGLLVVAPFGFDAVMGQRRPDLVGFLLLAVVGIWAAVRRVPVVVFGVVSGALLAVSALVSEVSPLIVGPWLVLVVAAAARAYDETRRRTLLAIALTGAPSALALGVLVTLGRATPATVSALEAAAPPEIRGHGSVFAYLGDTFRGSLVRVIEGPARLALSIVVGALLVGLLMFCARSALPFARATFAWALPTRVERATWLTGMLAAATLLFALGLDWLRWISAFAFAGLLATGAIVALTGRSPVGPPGRDGWQRPLTPVRSCSVPAMLSAVVAIYLLLLPPLPNWVKSFDTGARLLLDVPG